MPDIVFHIAAGIGVVVLGLGGLIMFACAENRLLKALGAILFIAYISLLLYDQLLPIFSLPTKQLLRNILSICSTICMLSLFALIVFTVYAVQSMVRYGRDSFRVHLPSMSPVRYIALAALSGVCVIGAVNLFLSSALKSTEIGTFYEKDYFTENYEATLYYYDTPIFCIATVEKTDAYDGNISYYITDILLPYGKSVDLGHDYNKYDPQNGYAAIEIMTEYEHFGELELQRIATDTSYALLDRITIFDHGEFCASRNSDKFHFLDCPHAQSIAPENYIYFDSDDTADLFGYTFCSDCWNRY